MTDKVLFAVALVLLGWGLYLTRPRSDSPSVGRIAQLEANVAALRDTLVVVREEVRRAEAAVQERKGRVAQGDSVLRIGVRRARAVLADTATPPDTVRQVLARTVDKVEVYQSEVLRYQASVDSLLTAYLRERQAFVTQIDTLTALTDAQTPARCAIWGVPCPNRTTAFLLGVGSALVLAVAVAF